MPASVNEKLQLARNFVLHTNRNVFLTGKAGTGKTTFLREIRTLSDKRLAVVAPTGVAAINAGGVTIHSLFQLPFGPLVPGTTARDARKFTREKITLLRTLDLLIIDEISMVRADVLDGIDEVLRRYRHSPAPFGGVQLLLIGDMQQLPPVIRDDDWALLRPHYNTGYFFGSRALAETPYVSIELTHIYRQSDARFIDLLNSIREKTVTPAQLAELNTRYVPDFTPADEDGYITLSTHNRAAQQLNAQKLADLKGKAYRFEATVEGDFPAANYPTDAELTLKAGAQVMFIKNDISREKLYYNGKIGHINRIADDTIYVQCPQDKAEIAVGRVAWTNVRYGLDPDTKEIRSEPIGTFTQYPLKLAWAITIHKSQGLTFEKAIIDASGAFAHGQVYVALSRCKSLGGLVLRAPIPPGSIKTEYTLEEFHEQVQQQTPGENELHQAKRLSQQELLTELVLFERAGYLLSRCRKLADEAAGRLDDTVGVTLAGLDTLLRDKIRRVGGQFSRQLATYYTADSLPEDNAPLQERLAKAAAYFLDVLTNELLPALRALPTDCDNQQVRDALIDALDELDRELLAKVRSFDACRTGFNALAYLRARNRALLDFQSERRKPRPQLADDAVAYNRLYKALMKWRNDLAGEHDTSGYMVLPQKTILELVRQRPGNAAELQAIKGFGKTRVKQFGKDILRIIDTYRDE